MLNIQIVKTEFMIESYLYNNSLEFYEVLLLGPLSEVYTARKENTQTNDWEDYSNLLIDKFAIHSSTFFHISAGIIEHKKSGETKRMNGYDLFTVNTTIRAIIETYSVFNHIFVEPNTSDEKHFRFLLWKLDGLFQEKKYEIEMTDFEGVDRILKLRDDEIKTIITSINNSEFIKNITPNELAKIYDSEKKKANWKFLIESNKIKPLKIIELIKHCCKTRSFVNTYKHASVHTHSNFPAIEEFKNTRGKEISDEYTGPIVRLAIFLTCVMISDICIIDGNAKNKLDEFPDLMKNFIIGINNSIKSE